MASVTADNQWLKKRFQAVATLHKAWFMRRRRAWNKLGPPLPTWFRMGIKRIDKRLVLQFVPPRSESIPEGVDPILFPNGVWYICGRMRHSRNWISKRAVYTLTGPDGKPCMPSRNLLAVLRHAKKMRRQGRLDALEREYEKKTAAMAKASKEASKLRLYGELEEVMRKMSAQRLRPSVLVPEIKGS